MNWKQWTHGRQKDSYCLKISVTDAMDILERIQEGKKIPRKFQFNLGSIIKDFVEVNNKFKKDYGRSFNCTENELHLKLKRARNRLKEITRRIDGCNGPNLSPDPIRATRVIMAKHDRVGSGVK